MENERIVIKEKTEENTETIVTEPVTSEIETLETPEQEAPELNAQEEQKAESEIPEPDVSESETDAQNPDPHSPEHKKKKSPLKRILLAVLGVCLGAAVLLLGYAVYLAADLGRINPENIYSNIEMSSYIYDCELDEIDRLYYTEDREAVDIYEIPEYTRNAFIAIEDKTFYKHHGLNLK